MVNYVVKVIFNRLHRLGRRSNLIIVFLILSNTILYSQELENVRKKDESQILVKAKLLTLSKYGIESEEGLISKVLNQDAKFMPSSFKDYYIISITNGQNNPIIVKLNNNILYQYCDENTRTNSLCNFVLVFSKVTYRYYLIKGFDICEIKELNDELSNVQLHRTSESSPESVYELFNSEISKEAGIDIECLTYNHINRKKRDKPKKCFEICNTCNSPARVE